MQDLDFRKARLEKLKKLRELGINPYPSSFPKTHTVSESLKSLGKKVKAAGKIFSYREHGNIAFADLKDETGKIQIFFQKKLLGENQYKNLKLLDLGDFIGVEGEVVKTTAGEISIAPTSCTLLSKSLNSLPSQWFGLKDTEKRFRQRYLDLLLNPEIRERFNTRTKLVSGVREYLDKLGFWEVETPTLQPLYGGANAKPFKTHVNALDRDFYLRIADELYLKRLIIGGYEKVYEICKDFRNEGIDNSHFPEFTMIEWYEAYADYQKVMDVAEGLFKHLAKKLFEHTALIVDNKQIDIGKKWPRITMQDILKEKLGLDVEKETEKSLLEYTLKNYRDIQLVGGETKGQLIFAIFEHKIPKLLIDPTWIIDYPQDVSPLSKSHRSKKGWVERFEGYIGGKEICDGWSELTDPMEQRERFTKDTEIARKDKEEGQHVDEDFLTAMEYGMPPLGGIGIGIDRLTMFFTNTWVIKEVMLFPVLRSEEKVGSGKIIKQDFSKKIAIVLDENLEGWQAMNALSHISVYIGNKLRDKFSTGENFVASDNTFFPRNTQYPIISLSGDSKKIVSLIKKVRESGLLYHIFIKEMIETTNDSEIEKKLSKKSENDIEHLGVGIFGEKEKVSELTKNFSLWK